MKKIVQMLAVFTVLMITVLIFFFVYFNRIDYKGRDMTYYNDCLFSVYDDYNSGMSEESIEEKYNCYIVLSKDVIDSELTGLYGRRALVLDFAPNGEYLGKIAWDDISTEIRSVNEKVKIIMILFWTAVLLIGYVTILWIYIRLIRPVVEMNEYASDIAKGNLDVELPIHKDNMFGSFTESFDMMRGALKASREREIESEKARKELVAALSHDIKTPIATIQATCEVMEMQLNQKSSDEKMLDKVGIISSKAELINELISNIFHATLEELDKIEVNVCEENSIMIEEYFQRMENYGNIYLDNHIPECLVYMDKLRMEQVIDNIIGNSEKYAGTDIHINFSEVRVEPGNVEDAKQNSGSFIKVKISDNGPGVPEEEIPLLTEKYYRGKDVKGKTGYGLGMYLVKLYMEKQGGGIEYYNDNGFTVELLIKKI